VVEAAHQTHLPAASVETSNHHAVSCNPPPAHAASSPPAASSSSLDPAEDAPAPLSSPSHPPSATAASNPSFYSASRAHHQNAAAEEVVAVADEDLADALVLAAVVAGRSGADPPRACVQSCPAAAFAFPHDRAAEKPCTAVLVGTAHRDSWYDGVVLGTDRPWNRLQSRYGRDGRGSVPGWMEVASKEASVAHHTDSSAEIELLAVTVAGLAYSHELDHELAGSADQ